MDIVFLGSGAFGVPTLDALRTEHEIKAVVTQPDRPAGRGKTLTPTPIGAMCATSMPDTRLIKPVDINATDVADDIRSLAADAWVVIAFGQKLSPALLSDVFAINLHASLLPRWRGAAPINWAIIDGDDVTGNSVITLADRMDAGLVLGQSEGRSIGSQTTGDLHDVLAAEGPALIERVLEAHTRGVLEGQTQDESKVTLAPKLSGKDRWVDFTQPAKTCMRRINGLSPWPGVSLRIGELTVKVLRAESGPPATESEPGRLVDLEEGLVACGDGKTVQLLEVQPAGKKPMTWLDLTRGRSVPAGVIVDGGRPA